MKYTFIGYEDVVHDVTMEMGGLGMRLSADMNTAFVIRHVIVACIRKKLLVHTDLMLLLFCR